MNEQVTKLIWEADQYSLSNLSRGRDSEFFHTIAMNKLAELIVLECINTVSDCSVEYSTRPQIVNEIKKHFGVEE